MPMSKYCPNFNCTAHHILLFTNRVYCAECTRRLEKTA